MVSILYLRCTVAKLPTLAKVAGALFQFSNLRCGDGQNHVA